MTLPNPPENDCYPMSPDPTPTSPDLPEKLESIPTLPPGNNTGENEELPPSDDTPSEHTAHPNSDTFIPEPTTVPNNPVIGLPGGVIAQIIGVGAGKINHRDAEGTERGIPSVVVTYSIATKMGLFNLNTMFPLEQVPELINHLKHVLTNHPDIPKQKPLYVAKGEEAKRILRPPFKKGR